MDPHFSKVFCLFSLPVLPRLALSNTSTSGVVVVRAVVSNCGGHGGYHHHHRHQFILETQNRTMSENTEQNNKTCVPRVRKAATALTTAHITKGSTV